jgi:uncharacterized protein involved in exopolysaccharide biosynthesis
MNNNPPNSPELDFSLLHIIGTLVRWRKALSILVVAATLLTAVLSLFIPNYYTASATFIPANEDKQLFDTENGENNSLYGDEDEVDRALIFAQSPVLIDFMIKKFNLAERYEIDNSSPKGEDKVNKRFRKLYHVKKNEYSGVEISIEDVEPVFAAQMLDTLIQKLDMLYKNATADNKKMIINTYENTLNDKKQELRQIMDTLMILRQQYGIYNVEQQSLLLASLIVQTESSLAESQAKLQIYTQKGGERDSIINLEARISGYSKKLALLQAENTDLQTAINLNKFNKGRDIILFYEAQVESISEELAEIANKFAQFRSTANSPTSSLIVVEGVQIPKIKSYPTRSLLVVGAAFLAFVLGAAGLILLETYRRVDWQKYVNPS